MPRTPWPENGCTLAEARERTADRVRWKKWNDRIAADRALGPAPAIPDIQNLAHAHANRRSVPLKPAVAYEQLINADFALQMRAKRLIAYGLPRELSAAPQLITEDIWPALTAIGWEESTAGEHRRGGAAFHQVRVFPLLLAPCRVDLVAGLSLAVAFKKFVLEDPEFVALAGHAVKFDQAALPMLQEFQFPRGTVFDWQWPIDLTPFPSFADVLNAAQTLYRGGSVIGEKSREACEVLRDRYARLLSLPKSGAVVARGTYVLSGRFGEINVAEWLRPSAWIDTRGGDFLEEIGDKLVPRWTGLSFLVPRRSRAFNRAEKTSRVRPISPNLIDGRRASIENRRRPVADAVAKALRANGLDSSPGSHTWKQIAAMITPDMPKPPRTVREVEALSKAVKRYYASR